MCCTEGEGSFALYSKGKLLFVGNAFGTSEEHSVRIDPADFIQTETTTTIIGGSNSGSSSSGQDTAQATWNTPTTSPPTTPSPSLAPIPIQPTSSPVPTAKPVSPTAQLTVDQERWYCGSSWDWVIRNCEEAIPCPGGDFSGMSLLLVLKYFILYWLQRKLNAHLSELQCALKTLHALRVHHALPNRQMLLVTVHL